MKSDGIKRWVSNDGNNPNGHSLKDGGRWCEFKDVEALVDSITRQRDIFQRDFEALKEENALVDQRNHATARLMAYDIKKVIEAAGNHVIPGASHSRLSHFAINMRVK